MIKGRHSICGVSPRKN